MGRLVSLALALVVVTSGCRYSFVGGGLPRHIQTIAVLPFENDTPQPQVASEVEARLQQVLPSDLGVRLAAESTADAVIRGRVVSYNEVTASFQPTQGDAGTIPVAQREVRITYEAEIYDMREDRSLWRAQSQTATGTFQPDSESPEEGRARAVQELVRRVIEGAQSQW